MEIDGNELDRYITGNYGEDQFADEALSVNEIIDMIKGESFSDDQLKDIILAIVDYAETAGSFSADLCHRIRSAMRATY